MDKCWIRHRVAGKLNHISKKHVPLTGPKGTMLKSYSWLYPSHTPVTIQCNLQLIRVISPTDTSSTMVMPSFTPQLMPVISQVVPWNHGLKFCQVKLTPSFTPSGSPSYAIVMLSWTPQLTPNRLPILNPQLLQLLIQFFSPSYTNGLVIP